MPSATRAVATEPSGADALERARHFFGRVELENVARLDPADAVHADAALEAGEHLADVVLEPLERADRALGHDGLPAPDPHLGVADHLAFRHVRAADRAELGDDEDLAHLGLPERRLPDLGGEHPGQRRLEIVDHVVDDIVAPDVHAVRLRLARRLRLGLHVEADDDGGGRGGEHDVALVDGADRAVDDLELDLVGRETLERVGQRLDGALHVGLEDQPELLHLARLDLLLQPLERDARRGLALELLAILAHGRDLPRLALVGDHHEHVARGRHAGEPLDLDGVRRARALDLLAVGVDERADPARVGADDHRVALLERAALDERGRDRAAAAVEPALDDYALRRPG